MSYQSQARRARLAFVGDVMLSRSLRPFAERDYLRLLSLLRDSDLAIGNLETVVRHPEEGYPNFTMGTPMTTPPELLADLQWMGIKLVSIANNHATDYGVAGVEAMVAHLRQAQFKAAGAGSNLACARAPAYIDTACGRIALVAATSFFRPWNSASDQRPDMHGRPGINPLGFGTSYVVSSSDFETLRGLGARLGLTQERARHSRQFYSAAELGEQSDDRLTLFGHQFRRGHAHAVETKVNRIDAEANLRAIAEARRQADWVVFSFHSHEFGDGGRLSAETDAGLTDPAQFAVDFAHAAIDAGADVVTGHGPHLTLGTELYRDRPIFYSLGNFIFQNDTVEQFPAESYRRFGLGADATPADFLDARTDCDSRGFPAEAPFWEGCLACVGFDDGKLARLELHPVDLGFGTSRAQRGRPMLATGARAEAILGRMERLSNLRGVQFTRDGESLVVAGH